MIPCNEYSDTDFQYVAGSKVTSWRHVRKRKGKSARRTWIHVQSWQRHTAAICRLACRPVDHPSRRNMSLYRPPCRRTACSPSARSPTWRYRPGKKPFLARPAAERCRLPCLYTYAHSRRSLMAQKRHNTTLYQVGKIWFTLFSVSSPTVHVTSKFATLPYRIWLRWCNMICATTISKRRRCTSTQKKKIL